MSYGGRGSRGFRISGRLILAILIALGGIVTYFFQTQENPTTGEKQHVALSPDQEIRLGLQAAPEMAAKMGGEVDPASSPEARMVEEVGSRIVANSAAQKSPWQFEFHLLDDPETINAFALPGGPVFITEGLYTKLQNEAQLAGVLAHEIGHVINRHSAEQMAQGRLGATLAGAVAVGASDQDDRGRGRMAAAAAAMANQMLQLKYSRSDESESDAYGMRFMTQAGYDPEAMLGVMKILKETSGGGGGPEFLQTHPLPQTRIDQIAQTLREDYPDRSGLTKGRPLNSGGGSAVEAEYQ